MNHRNGDGQPLGTTLLIAGGISAVTILIAFGLLALDFEYFWVTFILGFGVILPTAIGLHLSGILLSSNDTDEGRDTTGEDAAVAALRERYARGELTDAEFESRVERLVEAGSTEDTQ